MAASDHLHPEQLQMFMPAGQIASTMKLGDTRRDETNEQMFARKRSDNAGGREGYRPHNYSGGVELPLLIRHRDDGPELTDGHHRLVDALDKSPATEVPVQHADPMNSRTMTEYAIMAVEREHRRLKAAGQWP